MLEWNLQVPPLSEAEDASIVAPRNLSKCVRRIANQNTIAKHREHLAAPVYEAEQPKHRPRGVNVQRMDKVKVLGVNEQYA